MFAPQVSSKPITLMFHTFGKKHVHFQVAERGVPVAEFNLETTPATQRFGFHFQGPSSQTLPEALAPF